MSLITCPECGKEISDKSKQCIHCGFPIDSENTIDKPKFYKIVLSSIDNRQKIKVIKIVRELTYMDLTAAKQFVESLPQVLQKGLTIEECNNIQKLFKSVNALTMIKEDDESVEHNKFIEGIKIESVRTDTDDILICPRCGSTAVTTGSRGFSVWTGFLGSNKTVNRCGKCAYTWTPKR